MFDSTLDPVANLSEIFGDVVAGPERATNRARTGELGQLRIVLTTPSGETKQLDIDGAGGQVGSSEGHPQVTLTMSESLHHELLLGAVDPVLAFARGHATLSGTLTHALGWLAQFEALCAGYTARTPEAVRVWGAERHFRDVRHVAEVPGLPEQLTEHPMDQAFVAAALLMSAAPEQRAAHLALLFHAAEAEALSPIGLQRVTSTLADLAAGNSTHAADRDEATATPTEGSDEALEIA